MKRRQFLDLGTDALAAPGLPSGEWLLAARRRLAVFLLRHGVRHPHRIGAFGNLPDAGEGVEQDGGDSSPL
ncbi:hypothetical protein ACQPXM_38995 [Kribbella sp. CA-253562]|uniref:hypothetical protein n=1 Tax=Kribbella sp. CA-253562 TaxID=3239942 RepID=UPI003D8F6EBD